LNGLSFFEESGVLSQRLSDSLSFVKLLSIVDSVVLRVEWSLGVVVVKAESQVKRSHLLVPLVEDDELSINARVSGDKLKQGNFNFADHNVLGFLHESILFVISRYGLVDWRAFNL